MKEINETEELIQESDKTNEEIEISCNQHGIQEGQKNCLDVEEQHIQIYLPMDIFGGITSRNSGRQ